MVKVGQRLVESVSVDVSLVPEKDVTVHLSSAVVGGSSSETVTIGPQKERTSILAILRCTYHPSAAAGVRLYWLYSADGTNYDTIADAEEARNYVDPTFSAGGTRQRSEVIPFLSPYVRLVVSNLDANPVTVSLWTVRLP